MDSDKAAQDLIRAVELEPNRVPYFTPLIDAYLDKDNYENAFKVHVKLIELAPNTHSDITSYWSLRGGETLRNKNDYGRAIACYDYAIALEPNGARNYWVRGYAHYLNGSPAKAVADYTRAIALDPHDGVYYRSRADAYAELGDTARANADRAKADELR